MDFVPVRYWYRLWHGKLEYRIEHAILALALFQEGDDDAIRHYLMSGSTNLVDAVRVFEYGAKKYAAWNWAKGMQWSIPTGCVLRHTRSIVEDGEFIDPESGCEHFGHIDCNLIMLDWFRHAYPEGDDRPPRRA
jgi:hypothetical protein